MCKKTRFNDFNEHLVHGKYSRFPLIEETIVLISATDTHIL